MNKRILLATGAAILTLAAMSNIHKANAVTDTGDIDAVIVAPIVLDCTVQALNFGTVSAGAALGTVVMDTTGSRTFTGGTTGVGADVGTEGTCDLSGDIGYLADISISGAASVTGPGPAMTVDTFTFDYELSGEVAAPLNGATLAAAASPLSVGATLHVADDATQTPGVYAGTFTVEVLYQ